MAFVRFRVRLPVTDVCRPGPSRSPFSHTCMSSGCPDTTRSSLAKDLRKHVLDGSTIWFLAPDLEMCDWAALAEIHHRSSIELLRRRFRLSMPVGIIIFRQRRRNITFPLQSPRIVSEATQIPARRPLSTLAFSSWRSNYYRQKKCEASEEIEHAQEE